ncbi:MAG: adenosine deaminase [Actinomycetota bacterium]
MDTTELLRALPKVELHLHLEGSVDAGTFAELASKHGVELPAHDEPADLYDYGDLTEFLVAYSLVCASMRDRGDFHRVTYECLARCAASGARYVELFFSPDPHLELGVEYPTMLDGILAAFDDAEADLGVVARLVPAINRELGGGHAVELVELVADHRTDRVIGVGLDFNEDGYPPELFVDAYELAARRGLRRTSHAGEVGPAANVRTGIELLGCERVDHGYHVVDDPGLLAELAEQRVPFTVCPTTTTYTTVFRDLAAPDHAIRRMFDGGLLMTVASDDPPMFGVDLATEYQKLHELQGFTVEELAGLALDGLESSWLDADTKRSWRSAWSAEIDGLLAGTAGQTGETPS